jgi:hypothetical protein
MKASKNAMQFSVFSSEFHLCLSGALLGGRCLRALIALMILQSHVIYRHCFEISKIKAHPSAHYESKRFA